MKLLRLISVLPLFFSLSALSQGARTSPAARYGDLPLVFEPNQGQAPASVQFLTHGRGYSVALRNGQATLSLPAVPSNNSPDNASSVSIPIELAGAAPTAKASFEKPQITRTNYFLGSDPNHWLTNIPTYGRIRYGSIYPGIDVVYYGNERRLEHDFVVAPHADPSRIVFSFPASLKLSVDPATGDLLLDSGTKASSLRLLKPTTYQPGEKGRQTPVTSSYRLLKDNQVAFTLGSYNPSRPLIIDPVLTYATFLGGKDAHGGGNSGDIGNGIAVDASGAAYIIGTTYSTDFPVTTGSLQTTNKSAAGQPTVFVSKLNAAGTALIYSTYLGGSAGDFGYGIALDSSNNAYLTGATRSNDFPVTCTAFQATDPSKNPGALTGFVAELSANGEALTYSTYLGGSGTGNGGDISQAIALDSTGNAYVTGYTFSTDFPVTTGVLQTALIGTGTTSNAFVAKINPGGTKLLYATYLGGSGQPNTNSPYFWLPIGDYGNAIAVDSTGNAYIAGTTASGDFPITSSAYQPYLAGSTNAFVVQLNPAATAEIYATYLGGSGKPVNENEFNPPPAQGDTASAISLDSAGNIYVAGSTTSSNFPVTAGALQGVGAFSGSSGFVTKFDKGGVTLGYSTYLEGAQSSASSIAVDASGIAYIAGTAAAASISQPGGFVITAGALPAPPSSTYNSAYVVKLNASGSRLNYATLQGGSHNDYATAIALDPAGDVFITGNATSADLPVTQGALQTTNENPVNPGGNAFVSRFALAAETASTAYPPFPTNVPTTLTGANSGSISMNCSFGSGAYSFSASVHLATNAAGPPPTGSVFFNAIASPSLSPDVYATWGTNGADISDYETENEDAPLGPFTLSWSASYSGDAVYAPSTVSGTAYGEGCPGNGESGPPDVVRKSPSGPSSSRRGQVLQLGNAAHAASSAAALGIFNIQAAKFAPAPLTPEAASSLRTAAVTAQAVAACLAPATTATPVLSLASGSYASSQTITIKDATSGAAIYYTTDGLTPTASSTPYTGAITVASTETIKAVAIAAGYAASAAASATYTLTSQAPVTFSPASFTFPSTSVGSTSANQTLTITNNAATPLTFTAAAFSGTNASSFLTAGSNCSNPLAAKASCTVTFQFKPVSGGSLSATFSLSDSAAGSPQSLALTGTATTPPAPAVSFSPSPIIFPQTPVGTTSANQVLTVKNTGKAPLTFTAAAFSGTNASLFTTTGSTCPNPLPAAASCTVSFAYKPTGAGYASATFALSDNAPGSPQTVPLSGTSITGGALIASASSFTFPTTAVGSTSPAQTVTFKNVGTAGVVVTDLAFAGGVTGSFVITATTCSNANVLGVGASCTVSIAFKPAATGPAIDSFGIYGSYNSTPYPVAVALSGTGK